MIRSGYRLPWLSGKAPLTSLPPPFKPPADLSAFQRLDAEVDALLQKEATEKVICRSSPGFYGRIFAVPKVTGGWRPVLDLSTLNKFLEHKPFRMETAMSIRESMHPGDWVASIDLKDAYFHILIHPRDRRWLRFVWKDTVYQFRALPFGLSPAPWLFTKIARELGLHARESGIRLRMYLDDWLIQASSRELCQDHSGRVLSLCQFLGFVPNYQKSDLEPSQTFVFLGMAFDTVSWTVRPAPHRLDRLQSLLQSLSLQEIVPARLLASLLGQMESLSSLVPLGRLHKRGFQRLFRDRFSPARRRWNFPIRLGPWFQTSVSQWLDLSWLSSGVPLTLPPHQAEIFTDASTEGWGAHSGDLSASGTWSPSMRHLHINVLELEAVALSLQRFGPSLAGKSILLATDNTTVASYVNKQGGARSRPLSIRTERLLLWCQAQGISLRARHVPGRFNTLADSLSRAHSIVSTEWTLAHSVLTPVWDAWWTPHVDLFATRFSHRLPLFVSPVPDPQAYAVDAFSIPWSGLLAYAFPPIPVLGKVLRKAREDQATLILVAPYWPAQPWFPELLLLSHVPPIQLRIGPRSLLQPRSGIPHGNPGVLKLHAWLLCGTRCPH